MMGNAEELGTVDDILEKNSGISQWEKYINQAIGYAGMVTQLLFPRALFGAGWSKMQCAYFYRGTFIPTAESVGLAADMLNLANYAYGEDSSTVSPAGYIKLEEREVPEEIRSAYNAKTGFLKSEKIWGAILGRKNSGFCLEAWLGKNTKKNTMVIAFAGTHSAAQVVLDVAQLFAVSGCYIAGAGLLNMLMKKNPLMKFYVTGHSLGGGLTQFAVAANAVNDNNGNALEGYAFNPAGLSIQSLNCIGHKHLNIAKGKIHVFETVNDPVSAFFGVVGSVVNLPKMRENGHTIAALKECMAQYAENYGAYPEGGIDIPNSGRLCYRGNAIYAGEYLEKNEYIVSPDRMCYAVMDADKNLALYGGQNSSGQPHLLKSYPDAFSSGAKGGNLVFECDGTIFVEGADYSRFTITDEKGACTLRLCNNYTLTAYSNLYQSENIFTSQTQEKAEANSKPFRIPGIDEFDGVYEISCYMNDSILTIDETSHKLVIADRGDNNTRFTLLSMNDGTYMIYTASEQVIGVKDNSCNDRAEIIEMKMDVTNNSQYWWIIPNATTTYKFVNKQTEKCIDIYAAGRTPGTQCCLYRDNGADNQKFQFVVASGYLVRFRGGDHIYLNIGGCLYRLSSSQVVGQAYRNDVYYRDLPEIMKRFYSYGEDINCLKLIRNIHTKAIYLVVNEVTKYWIPSLERFNECRFSWDNIPQVEKDNYTTGITLG